ARSVFPFLEISSTFSGFDVSERTKPSIFSSNIGCIISEFISFTTPTRAGARQPTFLATKTLHSRYLVVAFLGRVSIPSSGDSNGLTPRRRLRGCRDGLVAFYPSSSLSGRRRVPSLLDVAMK